MDNEIEVFKPSIIIATTAPLTARQHDFYNFLLKSAYEQLDENYVRDTFIFSYEQLKSFNPRLKSKAAIEEFMKEIYEKEFEFNVLAKDKTIEKNVKGKLISVISKDNKNSTIEIGLEPFTVNALRKMIMKKKKIALPEGKEIKLNSYTKVYIKKNLTFYPSKVVFELLHDNNGKIEKMEFQDFKKITDTVEKYPDNYNSYVIKKIKTDLSKLIKNFKISLVKQGRITKYINISGDISPKTFNEFYENWLKESKLNDTIENKKIAESLYKLSRGKNEDNIICK